MQTVVHIQRPIRLSIQLLLKQKKRWSLVRRLGQRPIRLSIQLSRLGRTRTYTLARESSKLSASAISPLAYNFLVSVRSARLP